jgi:hypothetical protein
MKQNRFPTFCMPRDFSFPIPVIIIFDFVPEDLE